MTSRRSIQLLGALATSLVLTACAGADGSGPASAPPAPPAAEPAPAEPAPPPAEPAPPPAEPVAPPAEPSPPSAERDAWQAALDEARARWQARGVPAYELRQTVICFCLPEYAGPFAVTVENGGITNVAFFPDGPPGSPPGDARVRSAEQLFDEIQQAIERGAARVEADYDETGLPTHVFIDESLQMADEEVGWDTALLGETPVDPGFDREAAQDALDDARARWQAVRPASYRLREEVQCFCPQEYRGPFVVRVENGEITRVRFAEGGPTGTPPDDLNLLTVDGIHDRIAAALAAGAARVEATYDERTGVPTSVWIDESLQIADEEIGWALELLVR